MQKAGWLKISILAILGIISIALLILLISTASSILVNFFSDGSTAKNLTFTGNQNQTLNISIYRNANVTAAYMNLSGFNSSSVLIQPNQTRYNDSASSTGTFNGAQCGGTAVCSWDGNFDTASVTEPGAGAVTVSQAYNNVDDYTNYLITIRMNIFGGGDCGNATLEINKDGGAWYVLASRLGPITGCSSSNQLWGTNNYEIPGSYLGGILNTRVTMVDNGAGTVWYYEESLYGYNTSYYSPVNPENISLSMNNTQVWNVTGTFNQTNNRTSDLNVYINSILNNGACTGGELIGSNCSFNVTVHSDTAGIIEIKPEITWQEHNKPNLTLYEPNTTYTGITNVPLKFLAVDDYATDRCWFNVTRGASLEVGKTYIGCSVNTTFTVSGDATYIVTKCVNDTSSNENCTSATFKTVAYVPPSNSGSPGGGGGVSITQLLDAVSNKVNTAFCEPLFQPLDTAWGQFSKERNFENFKKVWFAFWNYVTCKGSGSLLPI